MLNPFSFLRLDKEKLYKPIKEKPQEIRKFKAEKQTIIYNTSKNWLRIQNFSTENIEVTYYMNLTEGKPTVRRFIIPDFNNSNRFK
jgi:hypothetical protein